MLDARRLVVLRAIAAHGSFTRAAEALSMTQPAVSRQLAALEAEIGVQLLARGPRHVALTPAGAALVQEAESIVPAIEGAERRLRSFADADGGAIRLGAVPSALAGLVADTLRVLWVRRPRAEVEVREGWSIELSRLAAYGEIDLAVVSGEAAPDADHLLTEPLVALLPAGHRLTRRARPLSLSDLHAERWVLAPHAGGRHAVLAACAAAGFQPRVTGTAGWEAAHALIAAGLGIALAPERTGARLRRGGVVTRALEDGPTRTLALVRPPYGDATPLGVELEAALRAAASGALPPR